MAEVELGAALRTCRERLGWSRETLAHHAGVSWSAIAQIESGRRKDVRLSSLSALATALGVTVDHLIGGGSSATPSVLGHRVLEYSSDDEYAAEIGRFLAEGVERSEGVLAVTSPRNTALLRDALGSDARHMRFADASAWYSTPPSAVQGYRRFLEEHRDAAWVRIVGEPLWIGRSLAELKAWMRYESFINLAFAAAPATIVCAYDARSASADVLADARRTHPALHSAGGVVASSSYRTPEDLLLQVD